MRLLKIMKVYGDWMLTFPLVEQIQLLFLPTGGGELWTAAACDSVVGIPLVYTGWYWKHLGRAVFSQSLLIRSLSKCLLSTHYPRHWACVTSSNTICLVLGHIDLFQAYCQSIINWLCCRFSYVLSGYPMKSHHYYAYSTDEETGTQELNPFTPGHAAII